MKNKTVLLLFLAVPIIALGTGSALLYRVAYVLTFLTLLGYLWSRLNIMGLKVEVRKVTMNVQVGQWLEEIVVAQNKSWLPKFLVEVHHKTNVPGHHNRQLIHLLPYMSTTWVSRTLCQQRGLFSFGAINVAAQDPFGLFYSHISLGQPEPILIYPATIELTDFMLPSGKILGEGYHQGRTDRSSPEASGVREYVFGDSFGHIHWRSTARTGKLMVKDFDREPAGPSGEVWLLLDMQGAVQYGEGAESTAEYGVTIAASLARKYMDTNRAVGLITWGDKHHRLNAQKGEQQWGRIFETLALVQPQGKAPLSEMVSSTQEHLGPNAIAIVITPASKESLIRPFTLLGERGIRPLAILLDSASFGGQKDSSATLNWLTSAGVETYVVRKGDKIERTLDSRLRGWAGKYKGALVVRR